MIKLGGLLISDFHQELKNLTVFRIGIDTIIQKIHGRIDIHVKTPGGCKGVMAFIHYSERKNNSEGVRCV